MKKYNNVVFAVIFFDDNDKTWKMNIIDAMYTNLVLDENELTVLYSFVSDLNEDVWE